MTYSMTGYSSHEIPTTTGSVTVELRSVNHRFLELHFRLPDILRQFEPNYRKILSSQLNRGKVECKILLNTHENLNPQEISQSAIFALKKLEDQVSKYFPDAKRLTTNDVLRAPGVLGTQVENVDEVFAKSKDALDRVIDKMRISRGSEGEKLERVIREKAAEIRELVTKIFPQVTDIISKFETKIRDKLTEKELDISDERLAQEIVLFASKIDIEEELKRLEVHLSSLEEILSSEGPKGKKLDFLMQELNREANTLGSKSADIETTNAAIQLKVAIEQIREQVQNIE